MKKNHDGWYLVQSQSDPSTWHDVNPAIGVCTCTQGRDGSPCAHQASIVYQESLNFICTMSSRSRFKIASIALGDQAITSTSFYASLHQKAMEEKYGENPQLRIILRQLLTSQELRGISSEQELRKTLKTL